MDTHRRRTGRIGLMSTAVLALVMLTSACAPMPEPATGASPNDAPRAGEAAFVEAGPFAVGVRTVELSDRSMEVWYPADLAPDQDRPFDTYFIRDYVAGWLDGLIPAEVDPPYVTDAIRDLPVAGGGPFPLVLFSHGFASYRTQSTFLTTHLASWGFVVISPDYLERSLAGVLGEPMPPARTDLAVADEAIQVARHIDADTSDPLYGAIDASSVLPVGHSAGGSTSLRLLARDDVPGAVPLAMGMNLTTFSALQPLLATGKPVTWIAAPRDAVVGIADVRHGYDYTAGPRRLIEVSGSGHVNAFSDICEIGDGGAAGLARSIGLPIPDGLLALGDDGCPQPRFRPSTEVWPEVRHFVTAQLRLLAGLDDEPVGLGDQVLSNFDDIDVYRHDP